VDSIKIDVRMTGLDDMDWNELAQDRDQWRAPSPACGPKRNSFRILVGIQKERDQ
jgi:hypothetical protein